MTNLSVNNTHGPNAALGQPSVWSTIVQLNGAALCVSSLDMDLDNSYALARVTLDVGVEEFDVFATWPGEDQVRAERVLLNIATHAGIVTAPPVRALVPPDCTVRVLQFRGRSGTGVWPVQDDPLRARPIMYLSRAHLNLRADTGRIEVSLYFDPPASHNLQAQQDWVLGVSCDWLRLNPDYVPVQVAPHPPSLYAGGLSAPDEAA